MLSFPRKSADFLLSAVLSATLGLVAPAFLPALALAEDCPGHPDALGTSRVLVVDPSKIQRVGVMQYAQSLPLADKEVVLTFDDGPLPPHSTAVLDILACAMRQGHVLSRRRNGARISLHRAAHPRGRTHDRDAQRASSSSHAKDADRQGSGRDRSRHRGCRRCAVGSKRPRPILPDSRLGAQRRDREGVGRPFAGGIQLRHRRRRLASANPVGRHHSPGAEQARGTRQGHLAAS